ncbi:ATP-binding protein [Paraburkholderia sp. MPAMCS5]|uniref:ATP-binding protein n=1 Tax=Paraburkholderia sp. MPAMCS5 TaxID=3112563 RepID=UPI003FA76060
MNEHSTATDHATSAKHADSMPAKDAVQARTNTAALRAPRNIADTGLPALFIAHLILKSILQNGKSSLGDLIVRHCLTAAVLEETIGFLVREHLVEIAHRGAADIDVHLRLTDAGRELAAHEASRSTYCGPAPVSLEAYVSVVNEYSVKHVHIAQPEVRAAFASFVADMSLLDSAVAALNAGRPVMFYGPAGSGKTYLAEQLGTLLQGAVPIPYAIYVAGDVIQLHDPLIHRDAGAGHAQDLPDITDRRWRVCERPMVMSGGELTLSMLDLQFNANSGFYQAPPHMKANMGMYVVDDLGRQRVEPAELLNRWITPLDRGVDQFALQSGARFVSPFDVWAVFSTNLTPVELNDNAFLRRLGSKLHVGALSVEDYRRLFDARCAALNLEVEPGAFEYLLHQLHLRSRTPFLACYPADLLAVLHSFALYHGEVPVVSEYRLTHAWHSYFGSAPGHDEAPPSTTALSGRRYAGT